MDAFSNSTPAAKESSNTTVYNHITKTRGKLTTVVIPIVTFLSSSTFLNSTSKPQVCQPFSAKKRCYYSSSRLLELLEKFVIQILKKNNLLLCRGR